MRAWNIDSSSPLKEVLATGAHSDDIEIGAAGTMLWLRQCFPDAHVRWVVLCATAERRDEARRSARSIGLSTWGCYEVQVSAGGIACGKRMKCCKPWTTSRPRSSGA